MPPVDRARTQGEDAVERLRKALTMRAASLINEHPEFAQGAAEVGLVDRAWLEDPADRPIRTATSLDVVQRFLERSVEKEPSLIANLGLNAIQMLTIDGDYEATGRSQTATVVFTDLEGFTRYTSRNGDEAARSLLERHHRSVGPIIRSRGGRIVKKIGDGLLVTFAAPEAAVLASLEIHETNETGLRIRAGLHHGEVVLLGDDVIGHDVNLAARVTDSAKGDEVLATVAVRTAVGALAGVEFGRARKRSFKGVDGSVLVCPVAASVVTARGRDDEDVVAPDLRGSDDRGPLPKAGRSLSMIDVLRMQRASCAGAGSALYGVVLGAMVDDVEAGGCCHRILGPWSDNAMADAVPLRFLAAVHDLVLRGDAPTLAAHYPSAGGEYAAGEDDDRLAHDFLDVVARHEDEIVAAMSRNVQTNEVGRAASLVGGFHRVAERTALPLRCLEVGASAGLLMRWDHYGYRSGAGTPAEIAWGDVDGLCFEDPWSGATPTFVDACTVAARRGCDVAPIDLTTPAGVARLRSFLWPDQVERRSRLDAAIEVCRRVPADVDQGDAGEWVEAQLASAAPGVATVVHHSIVLQYLPRPSFTRMRAAIVAAGESATPDAPVAWLRMEPAGELADVRLRLWPGDGTVVDEVLATTGYHGPPVHWGAPAA